MFVAADVDRGWRDVGPYLLHDALMYGRWLGADLGASLGAADDENPGDPDTITVTFDLTEFGLTGEREIYFRIEASP